MADILIVDDEAPVADVVALSLKSHGHTTTIAHTVADAEKLIDSHWF